MCKYEPPLKYLLKNILNKFFRKDPLKIFFYAHINVGWE